MKKKNEKHIGSTVGKIFGAVAFAAVSIVLLVDCSNSKDSGYTVVWKNYNNITLQVDRNVSAGTTVEYRGETPTRNQTSSTIYTFSGWNKNVGPIYRDTTYIAQFSETTRSYHVYFSSYQQDRGSFSQTDVVVAYGTTINIVDDQVIFSDGQVVTAIPNESDEQYIYSFDRWDSYYNVVTGDQVIYASFSRQYTQHEVILKSNNYEYGNIDYNDQVTCNFSYGSIYVVQNIDDTSSTLLIIDSQYSGYYYFHAYSTSGNTISGWSVNGYDLEVHTYYAITGKTEIIANFISNETCSIFVTSSNSNYGSISGISSTCWVVSNTYSYYFEGDTIYGVNENDEIIYSAQAVANLPDTDNNIFYTFNYWTVGGSLIELGRRYSVDGDVEIEANFSSGTYINCTYFFDTNNAMAGTVSSNTLQNWSNFCYAIVIDADSTSSRIFITDSVFGYSWYIYANISNDIEGYRSSFIGWYYGDTLMVVGESYRLNDNAHIVATFSFEPVE